MTATCLSLISPFFCLTEFWWLWNLWTDLLASPISPVFKPVPEAVPRKLDASASVLAKIKISPQVFHIFSLGFDNGKIFFVATKLKRTRRESWVKSWWFNTSLLNSISGNTKLSYQAKISEGANWIEFVLKMFNQNTSSLRKKTSLAKLYERWQSTLRNIGFVNICSFVLCILVPC